MTDALTQLTEKLAANANDHDRSGQWPADILDTFNRFGCWRWPIRRAHGGDELDSRQLIAGFEAVARGSMTAILILTQHDAAADLIVRGDNASLRDALCPKIAKGELLCTVGISQLSTSHQGGEPAMKVSWDGSTATFDGIMPWVTSAAFADVVVTAGVTEDGQQVLAAMPHETKGMQVEPALELAALQGSFTSLVRCQGARLNKSQIIKGPAKLVLNSRAPVRPLVVSSAGVGLAGALVTHLRELKIKRSAAMSELADPVIAQYEAVREQLYDAADLLGDPSADAPAGEIRASVNELVQKLALTTLTFAKGTGFRAGHPVQRLAREAMFFLVWSIPENVAIHSLKAILR